MQLLKQVYCNKLRNWSNYNSFPHTTYTQEGNILTLAASDMRQHSLFGVG